MPHPQWPPTGPSDHDFGETACPQNASVATRERRDEAGRTLAGVSEEFAVAAASGSLRSTVRIDAQLPHKWSQEGVAIETEFTGAHLLHLATAACILNDLYREAEAHGVHVNGVRVDATGTFDTGVWRSEGIAYRVEIDSPSPAAHVDRLLVAVDEVAEIPRVLRAGAEVRRRG
jgi:uncharacterized OsmC-like protein